MGSDMIWIDYREFARDLAEAQRLPSLRDYIGPEGQENEDKIASYLESAASYSGVGKIVGDLLDPNAPAVLFPGRRTDGLYVWPAELAYYVRKYHVRVPRELADRMASLNWRPPTADEIDWKRLGMGDR
jgi:hypothetical protein